MRILVAGDVEGNFKQLFTRVQSILKKSGSFEMLFCIGSFFSNTPECQQQWALYTEGKEQVPIPTFILGPQSTEHAQYFEQLNSDGGELCNNITCLGQSGLYSTSSGLQIAYLSGGFNRKLLNKQSNDKELLPYFSNQAVSRLIETQCSGKDFKGVDLLLTGEWPRGVENFTESPDGLDMKFVGAELISRLAMALKPRYHFAGTHHKFYERIPYRNHKVLQENAQHVTRFIGLAQVGNPDKKNRYVYAFSVTPMRTMEQKELTQQPAAVTNCPYTDVVRYAASTQEDTPEQNFFFDQQTIAAGKKRRQQQERRQREMAGGDGVDDGLFPRPKRQAMDRRPPVPRGPCWFCLGSAAVEKHLVVTIGDQSYIALPKGGLVPQHVLILPIGHYAASTDAPQEVLEELIKFRNALRRYFASKKQSCVIFERNFKSQHLQLQVIPTSQTPSDALRQAFIDHGRGVGVELSEVPRDVPLTELAQSGAPYFHVEFDDDGSLYAKIKGRFPLQFGREVLASPLVLNVPHRVDWKACSATKEEETSAARTMRDNFQPFDFTDE